MNFEKHVNKSDCQCAKCSSKRAIEKREKRFELISEYGIGGSDINRLLKKFGDYYTVETALINSRKQHMLVNIEIHNAIVEISNIIERGNGLNYTIVDLLRITEKIENIKGL
jgi:hypothetical protein